MLNAVARCVSFRRAACASFAAICWPGHALADEAPISATHNRVSGSIGPALGFATGGEYGPFCNGCWNFTARLTYLRKLVRRLEGGVSVGYWHEGERAHPGRAFSGAISLRPYVPLSSRDEFELGLPIHLGMQIAVAERFPGSWIGTAFAIGPDVRAWVDESFAVFLGLEFYDVAKAQNPEVPEPTLWGTDIGFGGWNAWAGALVAF